MGSIPKCRVEAVNEVLNERQGALKQFKENLRSRKKKFADANRTERSLKVGDWVYLKFKPYRQVSVAGRSN
jgi:hypothetical protein